jgi:hypothetical protein
MGFKQEDLEFFLEHAGLGTGARALKALEIFHLYRENGMVVNRLGPQFVHHLEGLLGSWPDRRQSGRKFTCSSNWR